MSRGTGARAGQVSLLAVVLAVVVVGAVMWPSPARAGSAELRDDIVCEGDRADAQLTIEDLGTPVPAGLPPFVAPFPTVTGIEQIHSYTVAMTLHPDGSADVEETIDYDFGTTPDRHGILRDLRLHQPCNDEWERVYPLSDVVVSSPTGAPTTLARESNEGITTLRIGDADVNVTGRHTYVIRYRLAGVVNPFPNHDELYWNAIGPGWTVMVWNATVRVSGPADPFRVTCFAGSVGSTTPCSAANVIDGVAGFQAEEVRPQGALTVAVAYPKGTFVATPRYFEQQWTLARAFSPTPAKVTVASLLTLAIIGGLAVLGFVVGRDRQAVGSPTDVAFAAPGTQGVPVPLFERESTPVDFVPPDGVRPAQLALVRDESVDNRDVVATIVDLAVRGYVRIEEIGEGRHIDYRLVRLREDVDELLPYERTLLRKLFSSGSDVVLSDLENTFASKLREVKNAIYDDAVRNQWFADRPDKVTLRWRALGVLITVVGAGLLAAAIAWTELALLPVPIVLGGLLLIAFASRFPRRTPAGTGLRRRISGFERFLRDSEAPRARWAEQRNIFSEYLPYAIVLGIAKKWSQTFAPLGAEAVAGASVWYAGHGPFSADRFGRATESFASAASSTLSSVPQSSSGSSGFSGGGGAGGGGGGGGGGSW